jgi:putative membrane protein
MMSGFGMGLGGFGFLLMAVFWIAIIAAAIWLLSNLFPKSSASQSPGKTAESAVDILKRRYAHGEIGREEYEAILKDLERA